MNKTILQQYNNLKEKHPDALLLFRSGDFYETYSDDAAKAAKILGITLTRYSDGLRMAGFPYHALDTYLPRLIRAGERVAICDQLGKPKPAFDDKVKELNDLLAKTKDIMAELEKMLPDEIERERQKDPSFWDQRYDTLHRLKSGIDLDKAMINDLIKHWAL